MFSNFRKIISKFLKNRQFPLRTLRKFENLLLGDVDIFRKNCWTSKKDQQSWWIVDNTCNKNKCLKIKLQKSEYVLPKLADFLSGRSGAKVSISCRSRPEQSHEYLLAKIGFDTAENGPLEVCQKLAWNYTQKLENKFE